MTETTSTAPNGEQFALPTPQDEAAEIQRLQTLVAEQRAQGREIVVVLGVGFVGAVMAGIVADSTAPVIASGPSKQSVIASGPSARVAIPGILDDAAIRRYFELGCEVKGLGRGHVKRIKDQVADAHAKR